MLHVEGAVDVDPGVEQLLHILPALLVAAAGGVAVCQLVHHGDGRFAGEQAVEIHLLQSLLAVHVDFARHDGELVEQSQRLLPAVGLHHANQDVYPLFGLFPHRLQHGVGLSHAGSGAEKHLQLALVLLFQARQQGVGPYLITHPHAPASDSPAGRRRLLHQPLLSLSSQPPVSKIEVITKPERAPSGALFMIQLQIQLENVDHLRAKDTSLCGRLDLLRQLGGIQSTFFGDAVDLSQHRIQRQVGIEAGGGAGQHGGGAGSRLSLGCLFGKLCPQR